MNKEKQTGRENYKETTGTKFITNTKQKKLKIYSIVCNFKNTTLKKKKEEEEK